MRVAYRLTVRVESTPKSCTWVDSILFFWTWKNRNQVQKSKILDSNGQSSCIIWQQTKHQSRLAWCELSWSYGSIFDCRSCQLYCQSPRHRFTMHCVSPRVATTMVWSRLDGRPAGRAARYLQSRIGADPRMDCVKSGCCTTAPPIGYGSWRCFGELPPLDLGHRQSRI